MTVHLVDPRRRAGSRNPLLAISERATRERWCWNLMCTTCGHMHFRYALVAVGSGMHPDSREWRIRTRSRTADWGELPRAPLSRSCQDAIVRHLGDLNLRDLVAVAPSPADWLGHLGVYLRYSEDAERDTGIATAHLVPQLQALAPSGLPDFGRQQEGQPATAAPRRERLRWGHLEFIELYIRE